MPHNRHILVVRVAQWLWIPALWFDSIFQHFAFNTRYQQAGAYVRPLGVSRKIKRKLTIMSPALKKNHRQALFQQ